MTTLLTIKLFKGSFDPSDDGWANDAWYLLERSGCAAESDAKHGWDEVSDVVGGEECVTLRTDSDGVEMLRDAGFRVDVSALSLVEAAAEKLDRDARELAHGRIVVDGTEEAAESFRTEYLRALAETCRDAAVRECGSEPWNPSDWLPGDSKLVADHAALLGVEADWSALWAIYREAA